MVVERTSPTYPSLSSSRTNSIAGAWRACNPTIVRTPFSAASAAIARASSRSRPSGHSQYTALPAASAAETSSRWRGALTVTATTSTSGRVSNCSWSENTALTPNASPAARADSAVCALSARISYLGSARSAGMWAVAAQPRTGLTPMIPTPSVESGMARADVTSNLLLRAVAAPLLRVGRRGAGGEALHGGGDGRQVELAEVGHHVPPHARQMSGPGAAEPAKA